jgi:hypothetical protein
MITFLIVAGTIVVTFVVIALLVGASRIGPLR